MATNVGFLWGRKHLPLQRHFMGSKITLITNFGNTKQALTNLWLVLNKNIKIMKLWTCSLKTLLVDQVLYVFRVQRTQNYEKIIENIKQLGIWNEDNSAHLPSLSMIFNSGCFVVWSFIFFFCTCACNGVYMCRYFTADVTFSFSYMHQLHKVYKYIKDTEPTLPAKECTILKTHWLEKRSIV